MNKVVIGADLSARLRQLTEPSFLADEAGNTVAYVLPPEAFHRLTAADTEPSPEERAAAHEEYRTAGGLTTAEAIAFVRGGAAG